MFYVFNIVQKILVMTSNIKNLTLFLISLKVILFSRKGISINSFRANITGYCRFFGRVAGHISFSTSLSDTQKIGHPLLTCWPVYIYGILKT